MLNFTGFSYPNLEKNKTPVKYLENPFLLTSKMKKSGFDRFRSNGREIN
jgi:hypothetical protein